MKRPATFIQGAVRAVAVLSVGMLGVMTAGCYDLPENVPIVSGADFRPVGSLSPTPISLAPLAAFPCTGGGFVFDPSFHLSINAGVRDVTLDNVTIHMIDGTNLGGPSITIPQPELARRFGSTLINAGTSRDFALRPDFGCIARLPTALRSSALLFDQRGMTQTIVVEGRVK